MLPLRSRILAKAICTSVWAELRGPTDLFLLFSHDYSTKIYGRLSFKLSFVHDDSTKNKGTHWFTLHKNWSFPLRLSSVNVTKSARNCGFNHIYWRNQEWKTSFFMLFYFFYVHTTIWPKYMALFHLFFVLCTTIWSKVRVLIDLFLLFAHDHSTKLYGPLSFIFP